MALSIFDRIRISAAVYQGQRDFEREMANFKKEQRRANRAAGKNKNNGDNTDSNNTGNNNFTVVDKKKTESKVPPTVEAKSEQQINAEAQAPEEPVGAEKISAGTTAEVATEAAMTGGVRIEDQPQNRLEFGAASIDLDKMSGQIPIAHNMFQQPIPLNPINPVVDLMNASGYNPMHQFEVNPMAGMNTYGNLINQQRMMNPAVPVQYQQPPVGYGHHKVDVPEKPKPPKPPKSEPEKIDMEGMPDPTSGMEVTNFKKFDARTHGIIEEKVSMEVEPVPPVNIFKQNNQIFYHDYPYLAEVEKVALDNGYQIGFMVRNNTNLIECHIYSNDGTYINGKGFTIDPGMIIDRRKKIFPIITQFYEGINAYPLFINNPNTKDDGKKAGNVLNVEVLTSLIVGGNDAVNARGMYSEDFRNLNKFVALITIPTDKNSAADRKYIQNRLVDLYKSGVFSDALATVPGSRFRVAEYNKSSGTILLDTTLVPANFGGVYVPNERIQLKISKDKCKTLRGDNIIDIPEKNNQY